MVAAILHLHEGACAAFEMLSEMRGSLAHSHDIGDTHAFGIGMGITQGAPCVGLRLFLIADDTVDLRHGRKHRWIDLRGAACHNDARFRMLALHAPDRLARLSHCLAGDGTSVDDGEMTMPRFFSRFLHRFGFSDVETATESEEINAHQAVSKIAGSNWPECSSSTGPVIRT